jgi:hypothetical protein
MAKLTKAEEKFVDEFNGAPYDDVELAEVAANVEGELGTLAHNFLDALRAFEAKLNNIGFERG